MNAHRRTLVALASAAALGATVVACGGASGPGQLAIALVDAPNPGVQQIDIQVTGVRYHSAQTGWTDVTLTQPTPIAVNLLDLQAKAMDLGISTLPAGTITQIRLLVAKTGNKVVTDAGTFDLIVPSGYESGIKIHGPWKIDACSKQTVTLDFDGLQSLTHPTGSNSEWILRPVVRVKKVEATSTTCGSETPPPAAPGGAGATCTKDAECLSGTCGADGKCAAGGNDDPCHTAADCASAACSASETCAPPPTAGQVGAPCSSAAECLSNACDLTVNKCVPAYQGQPCKVDTDCQAGMTCQTSEAGLVCTLTAG